MNGNHPLQYATENLELVKILAPKAKNLNYQNKAGYTILHLVTRDGQYRAFRYLMSFVSKINPNISTNNHQSPLHLVCSNLQLNEVNQIEMVKTLISVTLDINQKDSFNKSPTDYARENGFTEVVKMLSEKSIDDFLNKVCNYPNSPDINGRFPIHEVCMKNSLNFELNMEGRIELMKTLVILTANVNLQDKFGNTALHYAVENGFSEVVKILVKKSNLLIRNENGYAPINIAIQNNDAEIVKISAPGTTTFQLDFLDHVTRKRKAYGHVVNSLKRARYQ